MRKGSRAKVDRSEEPGLSWRRFSGIGRYLREALVLLWGTSPKLTWVYGLLTVALGLFPTAIAYVGRLLVDGVVAGADTQASMGTMLASQTPLMWLGVEAVFVLLQDAAVRGMRSCQALLRAQLGHRINVMILEKALTLDLQHFEDSEFYDKLTRARREASSRPLSLVERACSLLQNLISLLGAASLLIQFSPYALPIVFLAGLPSFLAEAKFSDAAFSFFSWKSEDTRKQFYYEMAMTQDVHAKEVKLFGLGRMFLSRYESIFTRLFKRERVLILQREFWLFVWGICSLLTFYGAYAWVIFETVEGRLSLGEMTMYLMLFRQGQNTVRASLNAIGAMYEDNLYLSTLREYLDQPATSSDGDCTSGPLPGSGIEFQHVSFVYPGASEPALRDISFHLRPGQSLAMVGQNGAGKTTLIKLLARLYRPTTGTILLDGLSLEKWRHDVLLGRLGVIFQDFNRYHLSAGENIGAGDVHRLDDEAAWAFAAEKGMAEEVIRDLPEGYQTQLGRWFRKGRELSGGQWQKIALSRAFMREGADILVFDEPTAAMDAEAEMRVFEHIREISCDAGQKMVLLISHRFSTVRTADRIIVIAGGTIVEEGDHDALMEKQGVYARLYTLQAEGFLGTRVNSEPASTTQS